jgi:hypothetical protein
MIDDLLHGTWYWYMIEVYGWMHIIDVSVHSQDTYLDDGMIHGDMLYYVFIDAK